MQKYSYDEAIVVGFREPPDEESSCIAKWLDKHKGQITTEGIQELIDGTIEGVFYALYCNHHYRTMVRVGSKLYVLITNDWYVNGDVVWETLTVAGTDAIQLTHLPSTRRPLASSFSPSMFTAPRASGTPAYIRYSVLCSIGTPSYVV